MPTHCHFRPSAAGAVVVAGRSRQETPQVSAPSGDFLGRLAGSQGRRGRKLGRLLLVDSMHRSWKNAAEVASIGVVAEALDEEARAF